MAAGEFAVAFGGLETPGSTAVIVLAPMNAEEFAAYLERAIPEFAKDKVASAQWSEASSLELSRQGYDELLPQGLATPENFLFSLQESVTKAVVGTLWYAIQERACQARPSSNPHRHVQEATDCRRRAACIE